LYQCTSLTDIGLKYIAEKCHDIKYLNLSKCEFLTDNGLKFIAEGCHNIQKLYLASNALITDIGLKYIADDVIIFNILTCFAVLPLLTLD